MVEADPRNVFGQDGATVTPCQWHQTTSSCRHTRVSDGGLTLAGNVNGSWASHWYSWPCPGRDIRITIDAHMDLFGHKTIESVVKGSDRPFTDADGVQHTWYGRCMIAVLDANRWVMALRSGIGHVNWGRRDAVHLITSSNEGRTWGGLNRWFDGSPVNGLPYEDGYTHSEPGLYPMPNGDLILQFWRTSFSTGTKQLRSTDGGKTWSVDIDRICVEGVPGAAGDRVIGCQDYFVDPENASHIYMAFEYFHYEDRAGCVLARSTDSGSSYQFLSWISPLATERQLDSRAMFEPAIEYVGNRTVVAILRDASSNRFTWQAESTDMGMTFGEPEDISTQVDGGMANGLWQRARLYKESNPCFQLGNRLDYSKGEGRLWGFGVHSNGGGYTRKPVVYWSDDNGRSWQGPHLLCGAMTPGTDTGYGDLKRRMDHTFVAATYYVNPEHVRRTDKQSNRLLDSAAVDPTATGRNTKDSDVHQYTFGGQRARMKIEFEGNDKPNSDSAYHELYHGSNELTVSPPANRRWRLIIRLDANHAAAKPTIGRLHVDAR